MESLTKSYILLLEIVFSLFTLPVFGQQSPYRGVPFSLPGIIEAEDYDRGGEGIAYHDAELENSGGAYRTKEGVDIEAASENGYNIGWIQADEWVEYSVDVKSSGVYSIDVRTASASDLGYFHIELNNVNITGRYEAPVTGGWQVYTTVTIPNVYLTAGTAVIRFYMESANFNVNYCNFILKNETQPPKVAVTAPANKSEFFVGEIVTIAAAASDPDGSISRVEFFVDGVKIGQDTSTPFSFDWSPSRVGDIEVTARAIDNDGASAFSDKVIVQIKFPKFADGPIFSSPRGYYEKPFDLQISTDIPGAAIKYSLDGSNPLSSPTAIQKASPATIAIDPQSRIDRGDTPAVVVRAIAVKDGKQMTAVQTNSYIFIERVRWQKRPSSWPESGVNGQNIRFDVTREVVNDARYKDLIDDALLDIPTMSLVTDMDNLFDVETGLYVNAVERGIDWERPASLELINPDGSEGFQINMGLRIRGGYSRHPNYPKHAFRFFFREDYGAAKLEYPLFGDEGTDEFDKIDLRCSQNYSWANGDVLNTETRDVFSRDVQREMGQPYTRSRFYHLYIDGMYWGLYETQERSEAAYAASYFGGSREDYDVVKVDAGWTRSYAIEATDGNLDAWRQVWDACVRGFKSNAEYFALEGRKPDGSPDPNGTKLVDMDNLIDYMLVIFHTGNYDSPVSKFGGNGMPNNYYAIYNRVKRDGFKFFAHDNEHTLLMDPVNIGDGIEENRVNIGSISSGLKMNVGGFNGFHPQWLHFKLTENAEYRQRFADRVYRHYFNKGIFLPERARALFMQRIDMIDLAIIAESARWGDLTRSKYGSWEPVVKAIADDYMFERYDIVLGQYVDEGLYPVNEPPLFRSKGTTIVDETLIISSDTAVELVNAGGTTGTIFYTLDGSDPRAIGGGNSASAKDAGDQMTLTVTSSAILKARIKSGSTWSALHSMTLAAPENMQALKISEIHYKPLANGDISGGEYEFLEIKNTGGSTINLGLASLSGVTYTFPVGATLNPGQFLVLASNSAEFKSRYQWTPFAEYEGQLDNSGERIVLMSAAGDTVINVRYNDKAPWPEEPDSTGQSLVAKDVNPESNANDPAYWKASYWVNGSPGRDDKIAAEVAGSDLPIDFCLHQNYPNPFNASTQIEFSLPLQSRVKITVYDVLGREIERLVDQELPAGNHSCTWDAARHAPGVYIYRINTSTGFVQTKKMISIK